MPNTTRSGLRLLPPPGSIGGMRRFRQGSAAFILAVVSTLAAGCGIPHDIGLAERCADLMQSAYPSAQIEITKSDAAATSLTTIIAHVEGSRSDVPPDGPSARDLAVECRFDENVLTGFHWTGTDALIRSQRAGAPGVLSAIIGWRADRQRNARGHRRS